jgi:hypothetical protein
MVHLRVRTSYVCTEMDNAIVRIVSKYNVSNHTTMSDAAKGKKRRPAAVTKYKNIRSKKDWFIVCQTYDQLASKANVRTFLQSAESGTNFSGTNSEVVSFCRYFKRFKSGNLHPSESIRTKASSFPDVETKLIAYIDLRARYYKRDKCGVSHSLLKEKAKKFAEDLNNQDFNASNGWLQKTFKRYGNNSSSWRSRRHSH